MENNEINNENLTPPQVPSTEELKETRNKISRINIEETGVKFAKFLSAIGRYIMMGVFFILLLLLFVKIFVGINPSYFKEAKKQVEENKEKVDSILSSQKFIEERMFQLEKGQIIFQEAITKNNSLITETNKQIDNLKRIYNEKIKSVNNYSIRDLDSFFANRYKDHYSK